MIVSMTGFASLTRDHELASVTATVRAVNHRYLDVQVRVPQVLAGLEGALKGVVQKRVNRGRVELSVSVQFARLPEVEVELNEALVAALSATVERARALGLALEGVSLSDLVRVPQALTVRERTPGSTGEEQAAVEALVVEVVGAATDELQRMRLHEGRLLAADLDARCTALGELVNAVADAAAGGRTATEERLKRRIAELSIDPSVDPTLIAQEVVRFAARSDISEELVRSRAHLEHWRTLAESGEPCGRKLDFLIQEMNREVNTIGSKAEGPRVSELVVAAKAELERMREQVQNVE